MTNTELWLTYHLASRAHLKTLPTTQLIELEFQNHKLVDLEDVLEHVFRQGFVEARHRPSTWWERKDGQKLKAGLAVEELLKQGYGKCPESALKLMVEDVPTTLWFTYVYRHNPTGHSITQRVKLIAPPPLTGRLERMANVTNHIFNQGFLAPRLRCLVHWEKGCGQKIDEDLRVEEVLAWGEGLSEDKPLRLIIDNHHEIHHHHGCSPAPAYHEHHCHSHHHEHYSCPPSPRTPVAYQSGF